MYCNFYAVAVGMPGVRCSTPGSVPVSHLANVEALVQRAAAEAATRCGAGQMEHSIERQSSILRGAPPSYAASTAVVRMELSSLSYFVWLQVMHLLCPVRAP